MSGLRGDGMLLLDVKTPETTDITRLLSRHIKSVIKFQTRSKFIFQTHMIRAIFCSSLFILIAI